MRLFPPALCLMVLCACGSTAALVVDEDPAPRALVSPATSAAPEAESTDTHAGAEMTAPVEVAPTTTVAALSDTDSPDTETGDVEREVTNTPDEADLADQAVAAFNGRPVPSRPLSAGEAAALFIEVQAGLRAEGSTQADWADLGHQEQLIVRTLIREPDWTEEFLTALDPNNRRIAELHLRARTELGLLHRGGPPPSERIPAWRVIDPEPLETLVGHYQSAGDATGIDWRILAGINLVETGMGRIDGVSYAGAQGPMQFLPSTWDEVSEGGDVRDPEDAIHGAARYLVRRGGLDDIRNGLWGYNNSDHYVNAVLAYAELLTHDEASLRGFYNWEIYVGSSVGTLWLPVGYDELEPRSAQGYLDENPWALTLG